MESLGKQTESKRRGAKFLMPDVGFSDRPWLTAGVEGFRRLFPGKYADRDFWVPDLSSKTCFGNRAPEQARSLQWMHHLVFEAESETRRSRARHKAHLAFDQSDALGHGSSPRSIDRRDRAAGELEEPGFRGS